MLYHFREGGVHLGCYFPAAPHIRLSRIFQSSAVGIWVTGLLAVRHSTSRCADSESLLAYVFNVTAVTRYLYPQWLIVMSEKEKEFFRFPLKKIKANKLKKKKMFEGFCVFLLW